MPRVIPTKLTQLSVLSASRKAPRMLKLSKEDYIKHVTVQSAWSLYQKGIRSERNQALRSQYDAMVQAMDALEKLDRRLYEGAHNKAAAPRFPMQLRVPTDFPPNKRN